MNNYNTEFSKLIKTFHPWDVGKWGEKKNKTGRKKAKQRKQHTTKY